MYKPKVSVIIPVYNVESSLTHCLDSACSQTLHEIEIICINDASPDNSLVILRNYAKKDTRIHIINFTENRGVSAARNAGIEAATGEYLGFIDSDDAVDKDYYSKLYAAATNLQADIASGTIMGFSRDSKDIFYITNNDLRKNKISLTAWHCKIYKNEFIRKNAIFFPIGIRPGQDVVFLVKALLKSNTIAFADDAIYFVYRRDELSISSTRFLTANMALSIAKCHDLLTDEYNNGVLEIPNYSRMYLQSFFAILSWNLRKSEDGSKPILAAAMINIYKKCINKNDIDNFLEVWDSDLKDILYFGDIRSLIAIFEKKITVQRKIAAYYRNLKIK